ncbi:hypothetical protein JCM10449v2_000854 [Rhodotorula kratochvilovae]
MASPEHSLLAQLSPAHLAYPPAPHLQPALSSSAGSPSPTALPPPVLPVKNPLFLSIDATVTKLRACVLDEFLRVIYGDHIRIDDGLPEYGTRQGVYTLGDVVTCPSEARIHALDLLLEKLARECPDPTLLSRIVAISGAGQPHTLHYLSHDFPSLLTVLSQTPHARLSSVLTAASAFSLAHPATSGDSSAPTQVRDLELHFGRLALVEAGEDPASATHAQLLERGRRALASRTGARASTRAAAPQLLKVVQGDKKLEEEGKAGEGALARTGRIVLEGGLFASVFLGRYAPADVADACSTNLFDPVRGAWDDDVLAFVASGEKGGEEAQQAGEKLKALLGEVEMDGGIELGKISPYFVQRFGFSPNCIIAPFSGSDPSTFLSFPLSYTPAHRDALISLSSVAETDALLVPLPRYEPDPERAVGRHPAKAWWESVSGAAGKGKGREGEEREEGEDTPDYVAVIASRDAGIGRALSRDMYCNGQWDVFSHLSAIVPHGGTIGLDDKYYSFFFPHGEATSAQGFLRFVDGARVQEFVDRKVNPRLLLESQAMSLRLRLGHVYRALLPASDPSLVKLRPHDPVGFPALCASSSPSRLILVGEAAQNPALSSLLSTMFNAPAFLPLAGGLRSHALGQASAAEEHERDRGALDARTRTSAAALGAAYKAAWAHARAAHGEKIPFAAFHRRAIDAQAALEVGQQGAGATPARQGGAGEPSVAGTFASSGFSGESSAAATGSGSGSGTGTAASALSRFSLPRPGQHARGRAPSSSVGGGGAQSAPGALGTHESAAEGHAYELVHRAAGEGGAKGELEPDPPGLSLVAMPDWDEWRYYCSMLPEFVRLERAALKGLV